jgi:hypothetical protein
MMSNKWCLVACTVAVAFSEACAAQESAPTLSNSEQQKRYLQCYAEAKGKTGEERKAIMAGCFGGNKGGVGGGANGAAAGAEGALENQNLPTPENLPEGLWFDNKTGLMWQMCPSGQDFNKETTTCEGSVHLRPYGRAVKVAYKSKLGGFHDWRLPTHADWLAFKRNALRPPAGDKSPKPTVPPAYLAAGARFPDNFWTSEALIFSKTRYVSKACFPEVSMIGSCGSSYTVNGKDRLFGTYSNGEGAVSATIFVRDGKANEIWDEALLREGIDTATR